MNNVTLGLVQMNPGQDKAANLGTAERLIGEAVAKGAEFVALPETFHCRGPNELKFATAEPVPGEITALMASLARQHGIYLLAGSFNEQVNDPADHRLFNTSLLFDPEGEIVAMYRKIHLFDVMIDGQITAQESSRNRPGDKLVTAQTPFGVLGLSICYDLRFPELYRSLALQNAIMTFVPSNFAVHTGRDHWEVLLRARAIENSMYIVAPATIGHGGTSFHAYGRSMIIDPWGTVIATAPDTETTLVSTINLDRVQEVRKGLPSLQNRRPETYRL